MEEKEMVMAASSLVGASTLVEAAATKIGELATISQPKLLPGRADFTNLLLSNPNYFGTMPDLDFAPVLPMQGNTYYEELTCIGLKPEENRLEGIIDIKRPFGYGGNACSLGSPEYVRFYVKRSDGNWHDLGSTFFTSHDLVGSAFPIGYSVSIDMNEARTYCFFQNLTQVRGILSWKVQPPANQPFWTPVWGNVLDVTVQIAPKSLFKLPLSELLADKQLVLSSEILNNVVLNQTLEFKAPKEMSFAELKQAYVKEEVPPHRFGFAEALTVLDKPILGDLLPKPGEKLVSKVELPKNGNGKMLATEKSAKSEMKAIPAFTSVSAFGPSLKLGSELANIIKWINLTKGDTTYEELDCVGYNPATRTMAGVISLKRSSGFSGGLCTKGSPEYVGFWAFYAGSWHYLGGDKVQVHDLSGVNPTHKVEYAVFRTVNLPDYPCDTLESIPVRAILSWNQVPTGPNFVPTWGNVVDTFIQPGLGNANPTNELDFLRFGGMNVGQISNLTGRATSHGIAGNWDCEDAPFGGTIDIEGHFDNSADIFDPTTGLPLPGTHPLRYQVFVNKVGSGTSTQLTNSFNIGVYTSSDNYVVVNQHVDTIDGQQFYTYLEGGTQVLPVRVLAVWQAGGLEEGLYHVELKGFAWQYDNITHTFRYMPISSQGHNVYIYNGYPHLEHLLNGTSYPAQWPELDLRITAVGGVMSSPPSSGTLECTDVIVGQEISGTYSVDDHFFGSVTITLLPISIGGAVQPSPTVIVSNHNGSALDSVSFDGTNTTGTSGTWSVSTAGLEPCGYTLMIQSSDRALVSNGPNGHYNSRTVGFCLRPNPQG